MNIKIITFNYKKKQLNWEKKPTFIKIIQITYKNVLITVRNNNMT